MYSLARQLHLWHRWLGIGLGLLVLLWFISGVVMLFVAYPSLTPEEKWPHMQPIQPGLVQITPAQASDIIQAEPDSLRLTMQQGRPLYHLRVEGKWQSLYADDGERLTVTPALARSNAQAFLPAATLTDLELLERDQWSISSALHPHRPLYRAEFANGTSLYVSSRTGEVVLDTTTSERAWNWLGSVIHWVYFTPLRADYPKAWRQVIMWLSLPATLMAVLGLWLGIDRLRLRRRYKGGRITPYRGWAKWHHLSGMLAGVFCLTWLFSGWLSVKPFDLLSGRKLSEAETQAWTQAGPLSQAPALPATLALQAKEIEWVSFGGQTYLLASSARGRSLLQPQDGQPLPAVNEAQFATQAAKLVAEGTVKASTLLAHGDIYYYGKRLEMTSPVIRIDFNDASNTSYYVDPATTRIVASQDNNSRSYRWLFAALHRLDFAPFDNAELPRWVLVIALSLGGFILTLAGMVMGWRRLTRA